MKSICIKTNNQKTIEYLLDKLNDFNLKNIYYSCKNFKFYTNIIIHFTGKNTKTFLEEVSLLLADLVITLFENKIINNIIGSEYFYFDIFDMLSQ